MRRRRRRRSGGLLERGDGGAMVVEGGVGASTQRQQGKRTERVAADRQTSLGATKTSWWRREGQRTK